MIKQPRRNDWTVEANGHERLRMLWATKAEWSEHLKPNGLNIHIQMVSAAKVLDSPQSSP